MKNLDIYLRGLLESKYSPDLEEIEKEIKKLNGFFCSFDRDGFHYRYCPRDVLVYIKLLENELSEVKEEIVSLNHILDTYRNSRRLFLEKEYKD